MVHFTVMSFSYYLHLLHSTRDLVFFQQAEGQGSQQVTRIITCHTSLVSSLVLSILFSIYYFLIFVFLFVSFCHSLLLFTVISSVFVNRRSFVFTYSFLVQGYAVNLAIHTLDLLMLLETGCIIFHNSNANWFITST